MLKIGIIGFGLMEITHYSIINSHPDVKIEAVVDTSTTVLSLINKYLDGIRTYTDYNKLFKEEYLDAVIISTPPFVQSLIAIKEAYKFINENKIQSVIFGASTRAHIEQTVSLLEPTNK